MMVAPKSQVAAITPQQPRFFSMPQAKCMLEPRVHTITRVIACRPIKAGRACPYLGKGLCRRSIIRYLEQD
jgi:hypothetical protein